MNSPAALVIAKQNVENHYLIVGILEEFNKTLAVLERKMPQFFKGASQVDYMEAYKFERLLNANIEDRPIMSETTRHAIAKNMTYEIEFYDFCAQRLQKQFADIAQGVSKLNG